MASDKKTWIKLFRDIQDNWMWREKPFSKGQAWIDLLLLAQSQDGKFPDSRGNLIEGERGTVYRSINWLADRWGWSRKKVDRFLSQLCLDGGIEVSKKRASASTSIKIVNYSVYQDLSTSKRTSQEQVEHKSGTSQEQVEHINNELQNYRITEEESNREKIPYSEIVDLYNSICKSYPRIKNLSDKRKAAIKARFNSGYTLDDFKTLFEAAERSDFLKGKNNRDWRATFDWLISDANMAKVLDGNYENRKGGDEDAGDISGGSSTEDYYRRFIGS